MSVSQNGGHTDSSKATAAGVLVAMGIVYGDIGTSPLYTYKAIIGQAVINPDLVMGGFSAIFWTITFLTTIKYIIVTLRADNNGEGGIFSLYALVRRYRKWLLFPAMIGGSFLLADGFITPPISVSSAIEGLRVFKEDIPTIPIVLAILTALFAIQQFGTQSVGKIFGPIMLIWFTFIGGMGLVSLLQRPEMLHALNPYYAYKLIVEYPGGFWLLGGVFLCSTGAEALYSDMGHCGRGNIRVSWIYVKLCLILAYAGQGAWLLGQAGVKLSANPFYAIIPEVLLIFSIALATMATIIASQALISGSFTLASEAMRLGFWPNLKIIYPTDFKGQLYIPAINFMLWAGCTGVVLYFQESEHMEAAYGLAVTMTMLMTTLLVAYFLTIRRIPAILIYLLVAIFLTIESTFFAANILKLAHGGWVSVAIGLTLILVMWTWNRARKVKNRLTHFISLDNYLPQLRDLSEDLSIPRYATNLIYLTASNNPRFIEQRVMYSIFQRQTKRADIYWFIHVEVLDEPFTMQYKVDVLAEGDVIWITYFLGFRIEPRINLFFRLVVEELVRQGEVNINSRYDSLGKRNMAGDFRFVVSESFLSVENDLPLFEKIIMDNYFLLKKLAVTDQQAFGLDHSSVTIEKVPLVISPPKKVTFERVY